MKKILLVGLCVISLISCAEKPKKATAKETTTAVTPPQNWLAAYMELKDVLVQSDAAKGKIIAGQFKTLLDAIETAALSEENKKAVADLLPGLRYDLNQIETLELDQQRIVFKALSEKSIQLAQLIGVNNTVYQQYCPMFAGGASWLSLSEEIRNPYFGDKMLKCGVVEATLAP